MVSRAVSVPAGSVGADRGADLFFVHLHGDPDVLLERMEKREHFMPPSLLQSQFDTLEMLEEDEQGALVDVGGTVDEVVAESMRVIRKG